MKTTSQALFSVLLALLAANCKPKDAAESRPAAASEPVPAEPVPEPAAQPKPEPAPPEKLEVGDKVTLDALAAAKWIQGEAPTSFEPGMVYIFECWATWCGPCVRIIPHVNELHKTYHEKGLRVYGVNVFEDGEEKVVDFVKKKGDGMAYPVAYTGRGSMFEKHWLKPAGVRGIPHAFVVIDGVLRLKTHPARISKELVESLLKGGDEAKRALEALTSVGQAEDSGNSLMRKFQQAIVKGDQAAMEEMIAQVEKSEPNSQFLGMMRIDLMLVKNQWEDLEAQIVENPVTPQQRTSVGYLASRLGMSRGEVSAAPASLLKKTSVSYAKQLDARQSPNPMEWLCLSSIQFKCEDKDAAKVSAAKAAEAAEKMKKGSGMPPAVFAKFKESVDADKLPTSEEFAQWIRESMPQKQPAP